MSHYRTCPECHGEGRIRKSPSHRARRRFQSAAINKKPPTGGVHACPSCKGSGLVPSEHPVPKDTTYPHVAIIGGGIGGAALAVACLHRGIPFTLYERDTSFTARSQGYGLTLQQASKAIEALGIYDLPSGVISTRHAVHTPDGTIIGEWGLRKWKRTFLEKITRRRNVHIARQTLRLLLLEQLPESNVMWGHTLTNLTHAKDGSINLAFRVGEETREATADLVVGADGIRSRVRAALITQDAPLQYLDCMVILGICPLESLQALQSPLLDSATVFQTVNGHERIYVMPYDANTVMWQASFPMEEADAQELSSKGAHAMKEEVCKRFAWHTPIPQMLAATPEERITGYPVYDRILFDPALLENAGAVTLLGDAMHPMSPFKGQGANQALLDALLLARKIADANPDWREVAIRKSVLASFEAEVAKRSASKVMDSAKAARILHTDAVLSEADAPRGH